jgi:ParB family transcriptional regulator, chromosome partitioning protein
MHPVDEFEAYKKLAGDKHGPEEIAARMGTTARHARVNPKLIALVRKGEMTMDQLEAFTVSDDQKKQAKVWAELPEWAKRRGEGAEIRNALTDHHIETDSKLVKFVGLDAYEKAGGAVARDLFDTDPNAG